MYLRPVVIKGQPRPHWRQFPILISKFSPSLNLLLLPHPQGRPQAGVGDCELEEPSPQGWPKLRPLGSYTGAGWHPRVDPLCRLPACGPASSLHRCSHKMSRVQPFWMWSVLAWRERHSPRGSGRYSLCAGYNESTLMRQFLVISTLYA